VAVNAGFMVGHSALRRVVMGERAVGHEATDAELDAMCALLATSLREGGLGFSSTISPTHNDAEGHPVPSRHASREELIALARVVRDYPGTTLEFLPGVGVFGEKEKSLMADLSLAANRPLNWNVLAPTAGNRDYVEAQLSATDYARERGAEVLALTVPQAMTVRLNLHSGFVFDALPRWDELFRMAGRRAHRQAARSGLPEVSGRGRPLRGRRHAPNARELAEHARGSRRSQRAIATSPGRRSPRSPTPRARHRSTHSSTSRSRTSSRPRSRRKVQGDTEADWQARARVWQDDRAVIGASDAGAHLDMIDTFAIATQVLGNGVRRHGVLSLEQAVHQLSDVPARLYGLRERGRLEEGWHADVTVFDAGAVGSGPTYTRYDLPTGAGRLYADADGIEHVLVNGVEIVRGGEHTGALPGTVLRSGRDTDTVEVPGGKRP
jgi:N-acyl-D-aspartate/D-glutamate deacylase